MDTNLKPHHEVVAAVIEHKGKILCVQRGETKYPYTSFKYEFPGGKIEEGESEQEALKREISEELRIAINIGPKLRVINHEYPDFSVTLHFYRCTVDTENYELVEHASALWATPVEMMRLDWVEADKGVLRKG